MKYIDRKPYTTCYMYIYTLGFSFGSLEEWKEFLWLAIPGVILISGEWWTFEIGSFVTSSIDGVQLAAYNIVLNMMSTGFVVRIVSVANRLSCYRMRLLILATCGLCMAACTYVCTHTRTDTQTHTTHSTHTQTHTHHKHTHTHTHHKHTHTHTTNTHTRAHHKHTHTHT